MKLNVHTLVKWFQLNYPKLVDSMKSANHHYSKTELNPYHLESDVFTHTMMVVLEASKNTTNDSNFNIHLLIAALLHDIGKPIVRMTNREKKRVHFFGHEPMSAFMALPILDKIEEDFKVKLNKRLLLEVISMHTDVFKVEESKLIDRLVNNETLALLLSRLSNSDHHGRFYELGDRITSDMTPKEEHITEKFHKQVVCYIGLPCSGKSTHIKELVGDRDNWVILSRDDIVMQLGLEQGIISYNEAFEKVDQQEVNKIFQARRKDYISKDLNVAIDMTNMSRKSRRKNLQGFKDYMKSAEVIFTSLDNINLRNNNRPGKVIPENIFKRMISAFQPPLYDEFHEINWSFN